MSTLTSLLSRDGVVSLDLIEQALQRQVLEGGELDTALLELGNVPENVLGAYRAASFELPAAASEQLQGIAKDLIARVPAVLAREHRVVPFAREDDTLFLATDAPLPLADVQRLARELGMRLQFRIATELRIEAALFEHYGIELPTRLRLLRERLRERTSGELRSVEVWSQKPPAPTASTRAESEPAQTAAGRRSSPVRVAPVVTLGASVRPPAKEPGGDHDTLPARPSKLPTSPPRTSARHGGLTARGPFTRKQAVEFLGRAKDRDAVIEVFFAFARQYFECTVLFSLRDERLLGLEASGLPAMDKLGGIDIALPDTGGSVRRVLSRRIPQVVDLRRSARDRELIETLDRKHAQPSALIPVSIRQRIVALLYGDRTGRAMTLAELSDLTATLPAVAGAFERIIHERKLHAVEGQRRAGMRAADAPAPEGTFRPSSMPPRIATPARPGQRQSVAGIAFSAEVPRAAEAAEPAPPAREQRTSLLGGPAASLLGMRGDAPPPPRVPSEMALEDDVVERPTLQLKSDNIETALRSSAPRARKGVSYSQRDVAIEVPVRRDDATRPERPSRIPAARRAPTEHESAFPPSPRTLSHPPPGAGSYALNGDAVTAADAQQLAAPAATKTAPEPEPRATRGDPRRENGEAPPEHEIVSIPEAVAESLRAPVRMLNTDANADGSAPLPAPAPVPAESSVALVPLGDSEAERLVDQLARCVRDQERPVIEALLKLGNAALPALKRHFPGPLWFDRHQPRAKMPLGRDVSAIARALFLFEVRAAPVIVELLTAPQAEVRLYAILLAADRCDRDLLWPVYQRLYDSDAQVRWAAFENLPAFRGVSGFFELIKALRAKAGGERELVTERVAALEAINALRDGGSVELLLKLSLHGNRQLSVPAHRSLVAITGQDFGDSERKWKSWLEKNRENHRIEWLMDSLMHADERLRNIAGMELQRLTHEYYGYVASAPKRERERVQRRYREWWEARGRPQFLR